MTETTPIQEKPEIAVKSRKRKLTSNAIKWQNGDVPKSPGRPKDTPEQKAVKRAVKEIVIEYKEALANALPEISPVLIKKAKGGDIKAIKEINDRVLGKVVDEEAKGQTNIFNFNLTDEQIRGIAEEYFIRRSGNPTRSAVQLDPIERQPDSVPESNKSKILAELAPSSDSTGVGGDREVRGQELQDSNPEHSTTPREESAVLH